MTVIALRWTSQVFSKTSLSWDLCDVVLIIRMGVCILGKHVSIWVHGFYFIVWNITIQIYFIAQIISAPSGALSIGFCVPLPYSQLAFFLFVLFFPSELTSVTTRYLVLFFESPPR